MFFSVLQLRAQETCTEKLIKANNYYEKGRINEALEIGNACALEARSNAEKWQAYRLLAISYLVNNQQKEARKAAEKMLELNPTYRPSALKDPTELIRLLKKIIVIPKFSMGLAVTLGGNYTLPYVSANYNAGDYNKNYSSESSWQLGVILGYSLNPLLSLHSGLMASSKTYGIDFNVAGWNVNVKERLVYLDVPLFARFTFMQKRRLRLFADVGVYGGYLLSSQSDFSRNYSATNENVSTRNLNSDQRRNNWEYGLLYGAGAMYKFGQLNIALDVKYYLSYANITNEDNRYKFENLFYPYYYIDDNLSLNNLAFSLSLIYNVNYRVIKEK